MNGQILTNSDRSDIVLYGYGSGTTALVVVDIGDSEGNGVAVAYVVTIEIGIVEGEVGNGTVVIGTIVYVCSGNRPGTIGIQLHRHILTQGDGCDTVLDTDICSTCGDVTIVVGYRQGNGIAGDVGTVEGGIVQNKAGNSASVVAAIVNVLRRDGRISGRIQLDGNVLADGHRSDIVLHRDLCGTGRCVVVDIGRGKGHGIGPYIGTGEVGIVKAEAGNSTSIVAAIVNSCGCNTSCSVNIQLHGQILTQGNRSDIVFYGDGRSTGTAIAVNIGDGQGNGIAIANRITIEAGIVQAEAGDSTSIVAAVVHITGGDASSSVGIQLDGYILTQGHWCNVVFYSNDGGTSILIAIHISEDQHDWVGTDIGTGEGGIAQR